MNLLRRIASLPGLRAALLHPAVRRRIAGLLGLRFLTAALAVDRPLTLVLNELVRARGQVRTYTVRSTGVPVALQHGRDVEILHELFRGGEYEPPPELVDRLRPDRVRRVLDLGANIGMFSAWATGRWPEATIRAYEPIEENASVYRTWAAAAGADVELVQAAAGVAPGTATFLVGRGAGDVQVAPGTFEGSTVEAEVVDVLPEILEADFLKIDIEGGEWPIFADRRLSDATDLVIAMEYHRVGAPSLPARKAAEQLLHEAGFATGYGAANYWGHGTLWAWKPTDRVAAEAARVAGAAG